MESTLLNALKTNNALTANGAVTHSTSLNPVLDLFFIAGASRNMSEEDILNMFARAYQVNKTLAVSVLFWARDCRGGAGERRFFRTAMKYLQDRDTAVFNALLPLTPEFGYWKDVFALGSSTDTDLLNRFAFELGQENGLLAKYFPRKGEWFSAMHKHMDMKPKDFRKLLVRLSNTVETLMCQNKWGEIKYSGVPSYAMNMYRNAFMKHDADRFQSFNQKVVDGEEKVNASVLFPHQLYNAWQNGQNTTAIEAQWNSLPNYLEGNKERIITVCDVSGSMKWVNTSPTPMSVSVALGVYLSERMEGIFKDHFITFSSSPRLQELRGDVISRFQQLVKADWGGHTDLQAVFRLILNKAKEGGVSQDQMPTKILIISDMEFNSCTKGVNNFDAITKQYEAAGYELPGIVFWNVNGRMGNVPVQASTPNTGLVSGFSPAIMTSVLGGEEFTPTSVMMKAISKDRYDSVREVLAETQAHS